MQCGFTADCVGSETSPSNEVNDMRRFKVLNLKPTDCKHPCGSGYRTIVASDYESKALIGTPDSVAIKIGDDVIGFDVASGGLNVWIERNGYSEVDFIVRRDSSHLELAVAPVRQRIKRSWVAPA